jgi:HEAT repeat protein
MPKLARVILLTSFLLSGFSACPGAGHAEPRKEGQGSPLAVQVESGLLSVDVRDVPLGDVLQAIAEQAGVTLQIHSGGRNRVTESFTGVGLDEGLQQLAQGHDVILVYGTARNGERGPLVEVHVYEASGPSAKPVVRPSERPSQPVAMREPMRPAQPQQPGSLASLTQMLASDPDPTVRANSATALGSLGGPEAGAALTAALGDQDPSVRVNALRSLGYIQDDGAVGSVARVLAGDQDVSVRRAAAWSLATFRSEDARRAIEAAASDPDVTVRGSASAALEAWVLRHPPKQ